MEGEWGGKEVVGRYIEREREEREEKVKEKAPLGLAPESRSIPDSAIPRAPSTSSNRSRHGGKVKAVPASALMESSPNYAITPTFTDIGSFTSLQVSQSLSFSVSHSLSHWVGSKGLRESKKGGRKGLTSKLPFPFDNFQLKG